MRFRVWGKIKERTTLLNATEPQRLRLPLERLTQAAFGPVVVYYWAVFTFLGTSQVQPGSALYFALVGPIAGFLLLGLPHVVRTRYHKAALGVAAYVFFAGLLAILRVDLSAISSIAVFAIPIIIVANSDLEIPPWLIVLLFWASLGWSVVAYYAGTNTYGFLPGQTVLNLRQGLWWRVSLFVNQTPVYSALFSLCVAYGTMVLKWPVRFRRVTGLVAVYFLLLSGVRSILIVALCVIVVSAGARFLRGYARALVVLVFAAALVAAVSLALNPTLLTKLPLASDFISSYVYRDPQVRNPVGFRYDRAEIWEEYLSIFQSSAAFGAGSSGVEQQMADGHLWTETRLVYMFAREGMIATILILALCAMLWHGVMTRAFGYVFVSTTLLVTLVFYSSYMNGYNFMYLLILGMMNHSGRRTGITSVRMTSKLRPPELEEVKSVH